jgi:hypothetical protein
MNYVKHFEFIKLKISTKELHCDEMSPESLLSYKLDVLSFIDL